MIEAERSQAELDVVIDMWRCDNVWLHLNVAGGSGSGAEKTKKTDWVRNRRKPIIKKLLLVIKKLIFTISWSSNPTSIFNFEIIPRLFQDRIFGFFFAALINICGHKNREHGLQIKPATPCGSKTGWWAEDGTSTSTKTSSEESQKGVLPMLRMLHMLRKVRADICQSDGKSIWPVCLFDYSYLRCCDTSLLGTVLAQVFIVLYHWSW